MQTKNVGKPTKCMNPEINCPNTVEPASAYVVFHGGRPLVLCGKCGPEFQMKAIQDKQTEKRKQN